MVLTGRWEARAARLPAVRWINRFCGLLREDEAPAFGFPDGITELPGCVQPEVFGGFGVVKGLFPRGTVRHAAGKLWNIGNEHFVLGTPEDAAPPPEA